MTSYFRVSKAKRSKCDGNGSNFPWKLLDDKKLFARTHFACAIHDERHIFVAGGEGDDDEVLRSAGVYDVITQKHVTLPDIPAPAWEEDEIRFGAVLNGYFYVLGCYLSIYRINIFTLLKWESMSKEMNIPKSPLMGATSDGKCIFAMTYDAFIRFDPRANKWTELPTMKQPRWFPSLVLVNDDIYVIGGDNKQLQSNVDVFHITTRSWRSAPPLPELMNNSVANSFSCGRWIIVTGQKDQEHRSDNKKSVDMMIFDSWSQQWIMEKYSFPLNRWFNLFVPIGTHQIMCVGGCTMKNSYRCCSLIESIERKYLIPNWISVKHFLLLRELVNQDRSHSKTMTDRKYIVNALIIDLNFDIFKIVLKFLI